jgi:hypothetical protein
MGLATYLYSFPRAEIANLPKNSNKTLVYLRGLGIWRVTLLEGWPWLVCILKSSRLV